MKHITDTLAFWVTYKDCMTCFFATPTFKEIFMTGMLDTDNVKQRYNIVKTQRT